jgi:murein DD-endopeptidase MepM/ murein hydrolase activator NlpD
MIGLRTPTVLTSEAEPTVFRTQEVPLASGFSIKYQGSFANLSARGAAELSAIRLSVLFPVVGTVTITQADGQFSGRITHTRGNGQYHAVDIGADLGTPVRAAKGGMVVFTEDRFADLGCRDSLYASVDNAVTVLHDDGTEAIYGHLRQGSARVSEGERVEAGDLIAEVGNSGASDGPHLHFQVGGLTGSGYMTLPLSFKCERGTAQFLPALGPVACEG